MKGQRGQKQRSRIHRKQLQKEMKRNEVEVVLEDLPHDLLGRIINALPDEARCAVIPCVSREFLHVHRRYPPQRTEWCIDSRVSSPLLSFFLGITPGLESLEVDLGSAGSCSSTDLLHQLLTVAAVRAPRLRHVRIFQPGKDMGPILDSLYLASQVEDLLIVDCHLHATDGSLQFRHLPGMRSLKELTLSGVMGCCSDGTAFWKALATLKHLELLVLLFDAESPPRVAFFEQISLLKNLRDLEINPTENEDFGDEEGEEGDFKLPSSFAALTSLTGLTIHNALFCESFQPVMGLPNLHFLSVCVEDYGGDEAMPGLPLESWHLTRLEVEGVQQAKMLMEDLLPLKHPLRRLRSLSLRRLGLSDFPKASAASLHQLTSLDLAKNCFARLPPAVSLITTLHALYCHQNPPLQLESEDVDMLAALPCLQILHISKSGGVAGADAGLTERSIRTMFALVKRLPLLRLPHFM